MNTLTLSQQELLQSNTPVVIFAQGRISGATKGLLFKLLNSGCHSLFINGYSEQTRNIFKKFTGMLEDNDINYLLKRDRVSWNNETSSVTFVSGGEASRYLRLLPNIKMVLVDNVEHLHETDKSVMRLLHNQQHRYKQLVFTSNPFHCGYRTPSLINGLHEVDITTGGLVYTEDKSWDYHFIDWKKVDEDKLGNLRAGKEFYKPEVHIINTPNTLSFRPEMNKYTSTWYALMENKDRL